MQNLLLTLKQKFCFGLARTGQARPKRTFYFEVNGRFCTKLNGHPVYSLIPTVWKKLASGDKIRGRGGTPLVIAPDGAAIYVLGGFAGKFKQSNLHLSS